MAGQHVVPVEQIPKGQAIIITHSLYTAELAAVGVTSHPLFVNNTGKRLVIQKAGFRAKVMNDEANVATIARRANASGTAIPVTSGVDTNEAANAINTLHNLPLLTSNGVPSANIIEVNEQLSFDLASVAGTLDQVVVTLVLTETVY